MGTLNFSISYSLSAISWGLSGHNTHNFSGDVDDLAD